MSVVITPASHPHLSSLFVLVATSMGVDPEDQFVDVDHVEVAAYEDEIALWSVADFLILAGIVDNDARFDELVATEAGSFVNHVLTLA